MVCPQTEFWGCSGRQNISRMVEDLVHDDLKAADGGRARRLVLGQASRGGSGVPVSVRSELLSFTTELREGVK